MKREGKLIADGPYVGVRLESQTHTDDDLISEGAKDGEVALDDKGIRCTRSLKRSRRDGPEHGPRRPLNVRRSVQQCISAVLWAAVTVCGVSCGREDTLNADVRQMGKAHCASHCSRAQTRPGPEIVSRLNSGLGHRERIGVHISSTKRGMAPLSLAD